MKKLIKIIILVVLVMVSGCAIQKKEENAKVIDTSMFLYKVSNQEGEYSYLFGTCHPGRYPIKSLDKVTEKALDENVEHSQYVNTKKFNSQEELNNAFNGATEDNAFNKAVVIKEEDFAPENEADNEVKNEKNEPGSCRYHASRLSRTQ